MSDASTEYAATEVERQVLSRAGRHAARARWGTTRVDRLVDELRDRVHDLGPSQIVELKELLVDAQRKANGETK